MSKTKYALETVDGSKALKKIADQRGPIFNRSHVFITPPLKPGYTIRADVMGVEEEQRRGDVGLINDRYTLEMFGATGRLRVVSWIPGPRFEKAIDFPTSPGRWYTMILRVDLEGSQSHVPRESMAAQRGGASRVDRGSIRSATELGRLRRVVRQFDGAIVLRQRSGVPRRRATGDSRGRHAFDTAQPAECETIG